MRLQGGYDTVAFHGTNFAQLRLTGNSLQLGVPCPACTIYGTCTVKGTIGAEDDGGLNAAESPADLLPVGKGNGTGTGMAEGIAGRRPSGCRERSVAGAMALASRNASMPADGQRALGNPHRSADKTRGARDAVPVSRTFGGAARFRQENAGNAG